MDVLKFLYFPLVNVATQVLKQKIWPGVPPALLPCFNVLLGIGISAGATALGIPGPGAVPPEALHLALEGVAIGGAATIAHNIAKNMRKR